MMHPKPDIHEKLFTSKKSLCKTSRRDAMLKESLTVKASRKRCKIGLQAGKTITFEELYKQLSVFAHSQWEMLPHHASDWERGQVDGLFWAMDKLDEIGEE